MFLFLRILLPIEKPGYFEGHFMLFCQEYFWSYFMDLLVWPNRLFNSRFYKKEDRYGWYFLDREREKKVPNGNAFD